MSCNIIKSALLGVPFVVSVLLCYYLYHPILPLLQNAWVGFAVLCALAAFVCGLRLTDNFDYLELFAGACLSLLWLYVAFGFFEGPMMPLAGSCCGFFAVLMVSGLGTWAETLAGVAEG